MQHDGLILLIGGLLIALLVLGGVLAWLNLRRRRQALPAVKASVKKAEPQTTVLGSSEAQADVLRLSSEESATAPLSLSPLPLSPLPLSDEAEPPLPLAPPSPGVPAVDNALVAGLAKTHASFLGRIHTLLNRQPQVDEGVLEALEETLLMADVGVDVTTRFIDGLRNRLKTRELISPGQVRAALRERLTLALTEGQDTGVDPLAAFQTPPRVVLFVGVNGVGKTTSLGKVAAYMRQRGLKVLLAAGDTFRAAATQQLSIWGERAGCQVIRGTDGMDPASLVFQAVTAAKQSHMDVVLVDTAGRLHTKTELMDEMKKVKRAVLKAYAPAQTETWLVVDATMGQNALQQAREFHQALGLTGLILTKLDGTAKGGVVVAIVDALKRPIYFVGVGEKIDDLRPFHPQGFVSALFEGPGLSDPPSAGLSP